MRADQIINKLCLTKTRSIAKKAFDKNLVSINSKVAKASSLVNENDIIEISIYGYKTKIKLLKIPTGNVSKKDAITYYELIERTQINIEE